MFAKELAWHQVIAPLSNRKGTSLSALGNGGQDSGLFWSQTQEPFQFSILIFVGGDQIIKSFFSLFLYRKMNLLRRF